MSTIPHPKYPLQDEEIEAIQDFMAGDRTYSSLTMIRGIFKMRRDDKFPDWQKRYNEDFEAWKDQGNEPVQPRKAGEKTTPEKLTDK